jgi:hypothetical protein
MLTGGTSCSVLFIYLFILSFIHVYFIDNNVSMSYSMATIGNRTCFEEDIGEAVVGQFNCFCTQDRGKRLVISLDMFLPTSSETSITGS